MALIKLNSNELININQDLGHYFKKINCFNDIENNLPVNDSLGNELCLIGYLCLAENIKESPKNSLINELKKNECFLSKGLHNWLLKITEFHNYFKTHEIINNLNPSSHITPKKLINNCFEGINQSGKSSRIKELLNKNKLLTSVRPFLFNSYFNNLTKAILDNTDISLTPEPLSATLVLLSEVYENGLFNNNIIYDRTPISTIIHQASSLSLNYDYPLEECLSVYKEGVDLLFDFNKIAYMKTPLDVCLERVTKLERYDSMSEKHKEHFRLMHQSFDKLITNYGNSFLFLDGSINNLMEDIGKLIAFFD